MVSQSYTSAAKRKSEAVDPCTTIYGVDTKTQMEEYHHHHVDQENLDQHQIARLYCGRHTFYRSHAGRATGYGAPGPPAANQTRQLDPTVQFTSRQRRPKVWVETNQIWGGFLMVL